MVLHACRSTGFARVGYRQCWRRRHPTDEPEQSGEERRRKWRGEKENGIEEKSILDLLPESSLLVPTNLLVHPIPKLLRNAGATLSLNLGRGLQILTDTHEAAPWNN
jgi:hypothetical protein